MHRDLAVEQRPADDLVHRVVRRRPRARTAGRPRARSAPWRAGRRSRSRAARGGRAARPTAPGLRPGRQVGAWTSTSSSAPGRTPRTMRSCRSAARRVAGQRRADLDDVRREVLGQPRRDGLRGVDEPLAEQEADRQLLVVARRAHRHRQRPAVDADLERVLDGDAVLHAVALHGHRQPAGGKVAHGHIMIARGDPRAR